MKNKGKKKVNNFEDDFPKKSNFLDEGDFIDKNKMDPTKFLSFLPSDYLSNLSKNSSEYEAEE
jgi:hypothetical protein